MIRSLLSTLTFLFLLVSQVRALSAILGSPCYNTCNGSSAATSSDIVCTDNSFANTTKGQLLENCLTCLHGSSYKSGSLTDSILFLYYVATVQQTCLTVNAMPPIATCTSKCSSVGGAYANTGGQSFFNNTYAYCSANQSAYVNQAPDCSSCLQSQSGSVILGNFVYVANYACGEQPSLSDGEPIGYSGNIFGNTPLNAPSASTTSATSTSTSTSASSAFTRSFSTSTTTTVASSSTSSPSANANDNGAGGTADSGEQIRSSTTGGMKPGAAAAVGIIVGLIGISAIIGLAILARRYQRARTYPRMGNTLGLTISNKAAALGATVEGSNSSINMTGIGDKAAMAEAIRREAAAAAARR